VVPDPYTYDTTHLLTIKSLRNLELIFSKPGSGREIIILTSENSTATTTFVNRYGGVLDKKLVAFRASDEPEIMSFHGDNLHQHLEKQDARLWDGVSHDDCNLPVDT
jgi:hypothetical protein